jgi:hypothetical protein
MPAVHIKGFTGIVPRTGATLLQSNQAQIAQNVKLQSGELRSWRKPLAAFTPIGANTITIYKYVGPAGASAWMEWATDVDIVASPIADTTDFRIYYTGQGTPKKTNWALATTGAGAKPVSYYEMGVPAPTVAPALSAVGGTAPTEVRAYVYTWVSTFGLVKEESAPSPATLVTCNSAGATVSVNGWGVAPFSAAGINYNITSLRIYRVVTGATTSSYFLVDEINVTPATGVVVATSTSVNGVAVTTSTYPDTRTVIQLFTILPSLFFIPPPAGLTGLVSMPNGIMVGFVGNQIWFSEPYYPHAWPTTYMLTTEFPIVGLGVFGSSLFVGTTKNPYVVTGSTPAAMSQEKMSMVQPCVSKRSIVFDQFGVVYAGVDGLIAIGPGVQDVITTALMTRDDWKTLAPSTMIGMLYNNAYMGFYIAGSVRGGIVMARNDNPPLSAFDFPTTAVFVERGTGNIFAVSADDNIVYQLDADQNNNTVYNWKSKRFLIPEPLNFAVLKVSADFDYMASGSVLAAAIAAIAATNAAIFAAASNGLGGDVNDNQLNGMLLNGSNMVPTPTSTVDLRNIQLAVFADGAQVFSTSITSNEPIRMPSLAKSYNWEVVFSGNSPVREFSMATSVTEMKNAQLAAQQEYQTQ